APATSTAHVGAAEAAGTTRGPEITGWSSAPWPGWAIAARPGRAGTAGASRASRRSAALTAGSARTRSAEAARPRSTAETAGGRPGRFGLCLLDDDGAALQHAARKFLDRRLGALVGHRFDEGEAARSPGLAVERDPHAAQFDAVTRERLAQFLLGHGVR